MSITMMAETIMGANVVRDFLASITDIIGGRSGAYESKLAEGRQLVLNEMAERARRLGADAVVGIDLDFETMRDGMMVVVATGNGGQIGRLRRFQHTSPFRMKGVFLSPRDDANGLSLSGKSRDPNFRVENSSEKKFLSLLSGLPLRVRWCNVSTGNCTAYKQFNFMGRVNFDNMKPGVFYVDILDSYSGYYFKGQIYGWTLASY